MSTFWLYTLVGAVASIQCQLMLGNSTYDGLQERFSTITSPHFVEATYPLKILCLDKVRGKIGENVVRDSQWVDFEGIPILGDRHEIDKDGSLFLKHAQHEDTRMVFCQLNLTSKFEHYVLVYDVPHVRLEYSLVYWTPMCLRQLVQQKAANIELLIEHNPMTLHHGLIYSIGSTSCHYSDTYVTAVATITIHCEDRAKTFKKTCNSLDCYHSQTKTRLLNSSIDSANRWREVESDPTKYPHIMDKYVKMPEFKMVSSDMKPQFVNTCPEGYFLWRDSLCLPCVAGNYYDNSTLNCSKCPRNSYQPFDLMSDCFLCPENTVTNSSGVKDIKYCLQEESASMKFIHTNVKFLIMLVIAVIVYIGLVFLRTRLRKSEITDKLKVREELLGAKPRKFASVDVSRKKETYISPNKKIIEVSRAVFLLEAGEKRSGVQPKLTHYAFRS